ncbi:MAG: InlB B-repeat-containing protein, partial [Christensenellaceae bacterium]|nr:InlB B-repeat-containing protein [Christensenellaceae bacterium]
MKRLRVGLVLLMIVCATAFMLSACSNSDDGGTNSTNTLRVTSANIWFYEGEADISRITFDVIDGAGNVVASNVASAEYFSAEDISKLGLKGVHSLTLQYTNSVPQQLTVSVIKKPEFVERSIYFDAMEDGRFTDKADNPLTEEREDRYKTLKQSDILTINAKNGLVNELRLLSFVGFTPYKAGFEFVGWAKVPREGQSVQTVEFIRAPYTLQEDELYLYAVYKDVNTHTVLYDSVLRAEGYPGHGEAIVFPQGATRAGQEFVGWKEADSETVYPAGASLVINRNYNFTSTYKAIVHTLTFFIPQYNLTYTRKVNWASGIGASYSFTYRFNDTEPEGESSEKQLYLVIPGSAIPAEDSANYTITWTNAVTAMPLSTTRVTGINSDMSFSGVITPNQMTITYYTLLDVSTVPDKSAEGYSFNPSPSVYKQLKVISAAFGSTLSNPEMPPDITGFTGAWYETRDGGLETLPTDKLTSPIKQNITVYAVYTAKTFLIRFRDPMKSNAFFAPGSYWTTAESDEDDYKLVYKFNQKLDSPENLKLTNATVAALYSTIETNYPGVHYSLEWRIGGITVPDDYYKEVTTNINFDAVLTLRDFKIKFVLPQKDTFDVNIDYISEGITELSYFVYISPNLSSIASPHTLTSSRYEISSWNLKTYAALSDTLTEHLFANASDSINAGAYLYPIMNEDGENNRPYGDAVNRDECNAIVEIAVRPKPYYVWFRNIDGDGTGNATVDMVYDALVD